jgi:hypothetical protein
MAGSGVAGHGRPEAGNDELSRGTEHMAKR